MITRTRFAFEIVRGMEEEDPLCIGAEGAVTAVWKGRATQQVIGSPSLAKEQNKARRQRSLRHAL